MTAVSATDGLPTTEVWFRNPSNYIRELVEVPAARKVIWDRGFIAKRNIDPHAHASLYFGKVPDWRILVCGEQGTAELDYQHDMRNPIAVYPTWIYGDDGLDVLEQMISMPMGQDSGACNARGPADEVPVWGQEHRIIISNLPSAHLGMTKNLLRNIREMSEDYEHLNPLIHLHGTYAFNTMFALGFAATDVEPRTDAQKGKIILPPGKVIKYEKAAQNVHWVNLMDMRPVEMKDPKKRCIYNIKSSIWAGQYWTKDLRFKTVGKVNVDPRAPVLQDHRGARVVLGNQKPKPGDMITCNSCSMQDHCKFFRDGAVCSLPESETSELAKYFKTRDSGRVLDGIQALMGAQAQRLERGIELEEEFGELDPEVTKIINAMINHGIKYAKLLDPSLTKPGVQINVGSATSSPAANTRQVTSQVVRAIQDETGLDVKDITPDMVGEMLARMAKQDAPTVPPTPPAIEVSAQ